VSTDTKADELPAPPDSDTPMTAERIATARQMLDAVRASPPLDTSLHTAAPHASKRHRDPKHATG
jgi:hypothetical protein